MSMPRSQEQSNQPFVLDTVCRSLIALAVSEDLGTGDLTSEATIPELQEGNAVLTAKEAIVVCGHEVARAVCREVNPEITYEIIASTSSEVQTGAKIAKLQGPFRSLLCAERTVLNFLQRLSGIASQTRRLVDIVEGTGVRLLDTRKTTPGWRSLEKFAVRSGGGCNHRFGLFDAVLIKDNHIDAIGGDVAAAVVAARKHAGEGVKIEVEVRNFDELNRALSAFPDAILLDNMSADVLKEAVALVRANSQYKGIELEASGGITETNLNAVAKSGVDSISLGALTHSVRAVDISMSIVPQ